VARPGLAPVVVKDYSRRGPIVRALIAPLLVRHELAMLERVAGLPGTPAPLGRIDRLALAMEYIDGAALRGRRYRGALPPEFFAALEQLLDGLAARGVAYLDLRSPSNILVTRDGTPALVDLASALPLRAPEFARRAFERRALRKLRARFERGRAAFEPGEAEEPALDLHFGAARIRVRDCGALEDPVPVVVLPEAGFSSALFEDVLASAPARGRRALGVDLPGFGASRAQGALDPRASARLLAPALDALRLARFDLVGKGYGGVVARLLACERPERVRALLTLDAPEERLEGRFLACWQAAGRGGPSLRALLLAELSPALPAALRTRLERELAAVSSRDLVQAFRSVPVAATPDGGGFALVGLPRPACPRRAALGPIDAGRIWRELAELSA
jgi:pimeloyl-ACP methyl ester carboxylesterase